MGSVRHLDHRETLIEKLEWLLERVRAGEVVGVAWARANKDGTTGVNWDFSDEHKDSSLTQAAADLWFLMMSHRVDTAE